MRMRRRPLVPALQTHRFREVAPLGKRGKKKTLSCRYVASRVRSHFGSRAPPVPLVSGSDFGCHVACGRCLLPQVFQRDGLNLEAVPEGALQREGLVAGFCALGGEGVGKRRSADENCL
mmetsp:Transcript_12920/g.10356  ORF Transcript_12920/g.10356 Transcript_12920/m.10356 type:complete len:119 (+) Transcript_12920:241-597(+)